MISFLYQTLKPFPLYSFKHFVKAKKKEIRKKEKKIFLFDKETIEECPWPKNESGEYAREFLTPLIVNGVSEYIENVKTDLRVLIFDQLALPITVNESEFDNSYVCSPFSYFITYAKESIDFLKEKKIYSSLNILLTKAGSILKRNHVNKVVVVNNWMCSTNLYPVLEVHQVKEITHFLLKQFPKHTLLFRSIDPETNSNTYELLPGCGYDYIASRQIFYIESDQTSLFDSRLFKSDKKLLEQSGYEILDETHVKPEDLSRICALYRGLYIEKYSELNPKFTVQFLEHVLEKKLMRFIILKKEGRIDGAAVYFHRMGKMTCPFFGYDQTLPKELSLYRLLSTALMLEARKHKVLFHQSSGASMFKKIRKSQSCIEYLAVYHHHLPFFRQLPWLILRKVYNTFGVIYMKKY